MAETTKIPLVILIILVLVSASLAITFFIMKEQEKQQRVLIEQTLDETLKAKEQTLKDLKEMARLKTDAELKTDQLKEEAKRLSQDLEKQKKEAQAALAKLKDNEGKVKKISAALEKQKAKIENLMQTTKSLKSQNEELNIQLSQIRLAKQALENKILMGESGGIQLEKIVVRGAIQEIEGRILVVNDEFNFVVLDLGEDSGIEPGTILTVTREGAVLGKVEVENVYEDMSSAIILPQWQKGSFMEDDNVEIL